MVRLLLGLLPFLPLIFFACRADATASATSAAVSGAARYSAMVCPLLPNGPLSAILAQSPVVTGAASNANTPPTKVSAQGDAAALENRPMYAFERGEIAPLCRPFMDLTRAHLDMCEPDPTQNLIVQNRRRVAPFIETTSTEPRGLPSQMGASESAKASMPSLPTASSWNLVVERARNSAAQLCCADDRRCVSAMNQVSVKVSLRTSTDGSFEVSGSSYRRINESWAQLSSNSSPSTPPELQVGRILISDAVANGSRRDSLEPVLLHEFGHACTLIRMQTRASAKSQEWFRLVSRRCDQNAPLAQAYIDYWQDLGESKELGQCLQRLVELNRDRKIDRSCSRLCPGHYLEEASASAFALLAGDLGGRRESVFPNQCDHQRDPEHPLVSDVVECLSHHSARFRSRIASVYQCAEPSPPMQRTKSLSEKI